jgi:hypothetical protein
LKLFASPDRFIWWWNKQVAVFAPEEMRDLEFEPETRAEPGGLRKMVGGKQKQ